MVIVRLIHGLGNQLFQYAMGRAVARRTGVPFRLDVSEYDREVPNRTPRQYMLGHFQVQATIATEDEIAQVRGQQARTFGGRIRRFIDAQRPYYRRCIVEEQGLGYDSNYQKVRPPVYLRGYWQSERYFDSIAAILREELSLKDEQIPASAQKTIERFRRDGMQVVGVHVRRGDYLQPEKPLTMLPPTYFEQAMARFDATKTRYLFFSDTEEGRLYCERTFEGRWPFVLAHGKTALHDFEMLRQCDHVITSNSTFSWWAAWLNDNPAKRIIAPHPDRWFKPDHSMNRQDLSSLIPETWVTLEKW